MKYKVLKPVPGAISLYLNGLPSDDFPCAVYSLCPDRKPGGIEILSVGSCCAQQPT